VLQVVAVKHVLAPPAIEVCDHAHVSALEIHGVLLACVAGSRLASVAGEHLWKLTAAEPDPRDPADQEPGEPPYRDEPARLLFEEVERREEA
jgi:hypothetical protein